MKRGALAQSCFFQSKNNNLFSKKITADEKVSKLQLGFKTSSLNT